MSCSEWKKVRLGDLCNVQTGPFGSQLHSKDYADKGTPIVTVEHLGNRKFSTQNLPLVTDSDKHRLSKYILEQGDIVFSRVGSVDRCSLVGRQESGWMFSGRCLRVRVSEKIDSGYLYYYFCQETTKQHIRNIAVGATMPSINTKLLQDITIGLFPLDKQKRIAGILGSLDDKIEINNKINANLEEQAQALFKRWFVDFEFPDENGNPYKSGLLDVFVEFDPREKINRSLDYLFFDMKCLSNNSMKLSDGIYRTVTSASSFRDNDTLLAKITPCLENGKTGFVMNLGDNVIARGSTEFVVMRGKEDVSPYWVYCLARSDEFRDLAIKSMTGSSGRQRVQYSLIKNTPIKYSPNMMEQFHLCMKPLFQQINKNNIENTALSNIRNTLLPKLMNNEIKL